VLENAISQSIRRCMGIGIGQEFLERPLELDEPYDTLAARLLIRGTLENSYDRRNASLGKPWLARTLKNCAYPEVIEHPFLQRKAIVDVEPPGLRQQRETSRLLEKRKGMKPKIHVDVRIGSPAVARICGARGCEIVALVRSFQ
jgi:hypothetical protein